MYGPQIPILLGTPDFSPYRLPGLELAYDFTDSSKLKVDASNRVSFAADLSGKSNVMGLVLPGTAGNDASSPNSSVLQITADLDLRVLVTPDTWTPASDMRLIAKWGGSFNSYLLLVNTTGTVSLFWNNSSVNLSKTSSVSVGLSAFAAKWIRATLDVDNGASGFTVTFYTSDDGATWTQLGTAQVGAGTTSIRTDTDVLRLGEDRDGQGRFSGKIYRAQIYNGIAGTLVFDANFTAQARGAISFTESSVNAAPVTVNISGDLGARICGDRDGALLTGSKQPLALVWSGQNYGWLPGVVGNYFSTPTNVNLNISGAIDIRAHVVAVSSVAAVNGALCDSSGSGLGYNFLFNSAGVLRFGTTTWGVNSSAHGLTTGDFWVRVTSSASGGTVSFYKSTDGLNWTALGTATDGGRTASGLSVLIGQTLSGTVPAAINLARLEIYSVVGGTSPVGLFDPSQAANNATSWTSSTGEVWTVNSTGTKPAQIVGRQSLLTDGSSWYMKTPPFPLVQPETVVIVMKQNVWTDGHDFLDGNATNTMLITQGNGGASPKISIYAGSFTGSQATGFPIGALAVLEAIFNGASSALRINRGTSSTGNAGANNGGGFTLGAIGDGTINQAAIQACRVFLFSSALDTATLDRIGAWCAARDLVPNF